MTDSMFLFEIAIDHFQSSVLYRELTIKVHFADLFQVDLKDPNEDQQCKPMIKKNSTKKKKKMKVRGLNSRKSMQREKLTTEENVRSGQSVMIASDVKTLTGNMNRYPMEISFWSRSFPKTILGSTIMPWNKCFTKFLGDNETDGEDAPSVEFTGQYNVFNELTSRCMAIMNLTVKLTRFHSSLTSTFRSLSEDNQNTFIYSGFNNKRETILNTIKDASTNAIEFETGTIKTNYRGEKKKAKSKHKVPKRIVSGVSTNKNNIDLDKIEQDAIESMCIETKNNTNICNVEPLKRKVSKSIEMPVKSYTDLNKNKRVTLIRSQSYTSMKETFNAWNYIFADDRGPFGNRIYYVGYFTVDNVRGSSSRKSPEVPCSPKSSRVSVKISPCDEGGSTCGDNPCICPITRVKECREVRCELRDHRIPQPIPDDRIFIEMTDPCCQYSEVNESKVRGEMKAEMTIGDIPCYCTCECTFGFTQKTTFCKICGGYERPGEDLARIPTGEMAMPCPIYHKLADKSSVSDTKKAPKKKAKDTDDKKGNKRFKFNYGYQAPHIGHSQCCSPCEGTLGAVPKNMGWLWTAENVPGMRFRPSWKPGAINKYVLRLLRNARHPGQVAKKRRKDTGKKKKSLKRPLLTVHKKDGEYTISMETTKIFTKPRTFNQYPYEDKPLVVYTIGRTEEENLERRKKKERRQRRLEREQRDFIQSTFTDMCKEICLKTYQQALGILPTTEDPECLCYPAVPGPERTNLERSCSCSEESASLSSDTDDDEWIVEVTPPCATYDPTYKPKKPIKVDNSSQYNYLDFKVKLLDRYGNEVVRFFKGPDGKRQCSDLGGFWSPDHNWLEINIDGFIGPDDRWCPMIFIGPHGDSVDVEQEGKFQLENGDWLVVGIDGYVDVNGKWRYYPRTCKKQSAAAAKKGAGDKKDVKKDGKNDAKKDVVGKVSETTWSCFGAASAVELSKRGIVGHGADKRLLYSTLQSMLERGEDVKLPESNEILHLGLGKKARTHKHVEYLDECHVCKHAPPTGKGVVVDERGHKKLFRLNDYRSNKKEERMAHLTQMGKSVSSFHAPCYDSLIGAEDVKQIQLNRYAEKHATTQVG